MSAATLVSARFALAACGLRLLAVVLRRPLPSRLDTARAVAVGLVYALSSELLFASLTHMRAALVDLLFFSYPAFVVVGAIVSRREKPSAKAASAVGASVLGTALVAGGSLGGLERPSAALAVLAAALYGTYILLTASLVRRADPFVLMALVMTGAAAASLGTGAGLGQLTPLSGATAFAYVAAVGLVSTVVGVACFVTGIARLGPSRASVGSGLQPPFTALLAFLVFGNRLAPTQLAGAALVLASIGLLETRRRTSSSNR
jgi:drug/metabolite transporter (DMT)-like permease